MNKRILAWLIFLAIIFSAKKMNAQTTDSVRPVQTFRVGIFAPLFLDSVFSTSGNFRYSKGMPKFIVPALDFVNGSLVALDSMQVNNNNVVAYIYDTKSFTAPLSQLVKDGKLNHLDLLIGAVKDWEYRALADYALTKRIPFISATYPNDGGITNNPFVVIMNSTLRAHCEAIFSYMVQNHGTDKIYLCRKKGAQEDKVASYFKMLNEQDGKPLLLMQTLNFDSTISSDYLKKKLDSNRQSVLIGGSLDERFAYNLSAACSDLHLEYPLTLIGMPNWDGFKSLKKDDFENFPIYFTTPYFNAKEDDFSRMLMEAYTKKTKGKPTDMGFKGFECTYLFTQLLAKYPTDFMHHLNDKSLKIFSEFNFRPVSGTSAEDRTDYFENKHLYFMRLMNGTITKAW